MVMLDQTKHIIQKLYAAGLKRSQFRVRTPKNRKTGCYNDPHVVIYGTVDYLVSITPVLLANKIPVVHYCLDGQVKSVFIKPYWYKNAELEIINLDKQGGT
jgi:hypothetical protein